MTNALTEDVTHIVLFDDENKKAIYDYVMKRNDRHSRFVHFVSHKWILESVSSGELLDEKIFAIKY